MLLDLQNKRLKFKQRYLEESDLKQIMISFDFHGIEEAVKLKNTLFLAKDFELFYSSKRIDY